MKPGFEAKLQTVQEMRRTKHVLWLMPRLKWLPLPMQRYDDPFLPFGKAIIDATRDLVCGYGFDLASYLSIGAAGAVALERTIAYVRADNISISILDGAFVNMSYVEAAGTAGFNVDAVTLMSEIDAEAYRAAGLETLVVRDGLVEALERAGMRLVDPNTIYASSGDDFAERVRATVQARRFQP